MKNELARFLAALCAVAVAFPVPADDRGGQALAAGNGAASSSRSHALREIQEGSADSPVRRSLESQIRGAAGLEETYTDPVEFLRQLLKQPVALPGSFEEMVIRLDRAGQLVDEAGVTPPSPSSEPTGVPLCCSGSGRGV